MDQRVKRFIQVVLLWGVSAGLAHAAGCGGHNLLGRPASACLADDVRAMDARLNKLYQSLLEKSPKDAKSGIEASQQAFIKDRDAMCLIDSRAMSRTMWFAQMGKSENLMLCEMRYLHARAGQLEKLLSETGQAAPLTAGRLRFSLANEDYQLVSRNAHKRGRWYMEITVNGAALANVHDAPSAAIQMICGSQVEQKGNGWLAYASAQGNHGSAVYRLALDLDRGRIYFGRNRKWMNGKPGVSGGNATISGGLYSICGVFSTQKIADLVASGTVDVNFGERPFAYAPPASFEPFLEKPLWVDAKDASLTLSVDYSSIDLGGDKPSILVRNEFNAPQTSKDGYRFLTSYGQFEVDCSAMSFNQVLTGVSSGPDAGYSVSANMRPDQPVTASSLGNNSFMGNAAKTLCFMKKNGLPWPRIDQTGKWESMRSPVTGVSISEAPDRRMYRNGYMLAKVKNAFSSDVAQFGGMAGTSHIGYIAVDCGKGRSNSLLVAGFDAQGKIQGGSFYNDDDAMPKLPENRKRYEDACRDYLGNRQAYESRGASHAATAVPAVPAPAATPLVAASLPHPKKARAAVPPKRAKAVHLARRAHPHTRKKERYASRDKDLRYCLDKANEAEIISCTEQGDRAAP